MNLEYDKAEKVIKAFSARVYRRIRAAGDHSISYEDLCQEGWIAYAIAVNNYNGEKMVPFMPYFINGMKRHLNRYVDKFFERRNEVLAGNLVRNTDDSDGLTQDDVLDAISSAPPTQEKALIEKQTYANVMGRLSPRGRIFVRLLHEQPRELLEQVTMIAARYEYGRSKGMASHNSHRLTASMVFDLMDATHSERARIAKEVRQLGSKILSQST